MALLLGSIGGIRHTLPYTAWRVVPALTFFPIAAGFRINAKERPSPPASARRPVLPRRATPAIVGTPAYARVPGLREHDPASLVPIPIYLVPALSVCTAPARAIHSMLFAIGVPPE